MKLEVSGRHIEVTSAMKTFTREKIQKLQRWVDELMEAHVILTVEKHRHIAEIVAHGRHVTLSAREVSSDMYTSIGQCLEKLERQAQKHKEKHETKRRRTAGKQPEIPKPPPEPEPEEEKPKKAARRRTAAARSGNGLPPIVRTETFSRKPMSVEEAGMQLRDSDMEFFVFRNARSREVNVLYRRRDGSLGLIEPES